MSTDIPTAWDDREREAAGRPVGEGGTGAAEDTEAVPPAPAGAELPAGGAIPADLVDHPRYRLLGLLGSGGMGTVYKARHRYMDRVVALKVVRPNLLDRPGLVERFRQEIQAAARLSHPNIVTAYDADRAGDSHFLVMEYVPGVNLDQVLAQRGRLPVALACDYARQAALGLQHAFEKGLVHRDVKPRNLMVVNGRMGSGEDRDTTHHPPTTHHVKILDFGLAHFASERLLTPAGFPPRADAEEADTVRLAQLSDRLTAAYAAMGTADYMAPEEVLDARRADIRADVYSLGATLYHLLAGRVPFPEGAPLDKLQSHLDREPAALTALRPEVPPALAEVVARMLAKSPADRYPTPAEVVRALAPFVAPAPRHVLVVDDDPALCEALAAALEDRGHVVDTAANGREALERLRRGPLPSLIVLDLMMPVMDGWQFLREQQRDPALAAVPVMILSAADREQAAAAVPGVAEYLAKPIGMRELAEHVALHTGLN